MAIDCSSFEMHEVLALQCRDNVGCGVDQPAIDVLHLFDLKTSRRPRTGFRSLSPENVWQQVEGGQTPPGAARHLIWARTRRRDSAHPVSRRPAGSTLWKSAAFTFVDLGRLEDMPVRCLTPSTQQRVRPGGRAFRPPLRPRAGAPGPRGNSCVPGLPDHRTASCAEFAGRRLIGAPVPLSRHAQEGLDPRRRDPPGETAPVPAGGAQPGRSGPASRRGAGRQASCHSDDVLRRSTADGQVDRIVRVRVCPPADTSAQTSAAASARRKPPAEQQPDNGGVDARSRPPRPSPRTRARGRAGRRSRAAGISSRAGAAPPRAAGRAGARCRAACPRREASTGPAPANGESPRPRSGHGVPFMLPLPVRNGRRTGCRR